MSTAAAAASPGPGALNPHRRRSLLGICAITALVWVTASDISIALPTIGRDLGGSMDTLQWAVNGYFLAGSLIIVGGRLADLFGRRLLFAIGTALLIAGSVLSGLAAGTGLLVLGRIIEGVGAAAILPAALAIVAVEFPEEERDGAIAAWIATCWGAQALGPLVGGALVAALGWTSIFWINVPLGLAGLWLAWTSTWESKADEEDGRVDIPGLVTLVGGIFLISYGLVGADTLGAGEMVGIFVAAVLLLVAFVAIERRVRSPLVDLRVFRLRRFNGAVVANLMANVVFGAVVFFMALYLQVGLGHSALEAGALLLPATLPILLLNPLGERWGRRAPGPPIFWGMVLLVVAGVLLTFMPSSYGVLVIPFVILGAGIGLQITPTAALAVKAGETAGEGVASGVYKAASMIGGSLGVAAGTAVFQRGARHHIDALLGSVTPNADQLDRFLNVLTGSLPVRALQSLLGPKAQALVLDTFQAAAGQAMWLVTGAAVIGVVLSWWFLLRGEDGTPEDAPAG